MFSNHVNLKRSFSREQIARWIENLTNGSAHSEEEKREMRALAHHFRASEKPVSVFGFRKAVRKAT
jgi:hypothetical protein